MDAADGLWLALGVLLMQGAVVTWSGWLGLVRCLHNVAEKAGTSADELGLGLGEEAALFT